jgi:hypothetical protein
MRHILILLVFISLGLHSYSQDKPEELQKQTILKLLELKKSFSTLRSYRYEALLKVTSSDEFLEVYSPKDKAIQASSKFGEYNILGAASGEKLFVRREKIDAKKNVLETTEFYVSPENTISKIVDSESHASIVPTEQGETKHFYNYLDGLFINYGFLSPNLSNFGVPALYPQDIGSDLLWKNFLDNVTVSLSAGGIVTLVCNRGDYELRVTLEKETYFPKEFSLLTKAGALICRISVDSFGAGTAFPGIAKKITLKTYSPLLQNGGKSLQIATWEYEITKIEALTTLSDENADFDPTSVDKIWDQEQKRMINVPR